MKVKYTYLMIALGLAGVLSFQAFAATGATTAGTSTADVTAAASSAAKKVLAELEVSMKKIEDMAENNGKPEELRAEIDKARKVVNDAVDRVSVTGGRGTQRNFALRQMEARLEKFSAVAAKNAEAATKTELKNLKDGLKKVETAFRH